MVSGQGVDSVTFHHFRPSLSSILAIVSHGTLEPVGIRARCRFSDLSSLPSVSLFHLGHCVARNPGACWYPGKVLIQWPFITSVRLFGPL